MAPKVSGAWHLHALTQNMPLDIFVLFSSAAAVLGSAGQGNYAAANSFLDGLAHYRKQRGLLATSINWGAWAERGMAADLDMQSPERRASREVDLIRPLDGMRIMEQVINQKAVQTIVLPVDWKKFNNKSVQPLFQEIVPEKANSSLSGPRVTILEQLNNMAPDERAGVLDEYTKEQIINILRLDPSQPIHSLRSLTEIGLELVNGSRVKE